MELSQDDFKRLENKVDKLTDAVTRLILVEERLSTQGVRIGSLETRAALSETAVQRVDRKVDSWVNRGIGVWGLAVTVFALLQFVSKAFGNS